MSDMNTADYPMANPPLLPEDFYKSQLASIPYAMATIKAGTYEIVFVNNLFLKEFGKDVTELSASLQNLLDDQHYLLLGNHIRLIQDNPEEETKYILYSIKDKAGNYHNYYGYVISVKEDNKAGGYYNFFLCPEFSRQPLPFTSVDSREIFLEEFNKLGFGTFEWLPEQDIVLWSDGVYKIYEVDPSVKNIKRETVSQYTHPDDKMIASEMVARSLKSGGSFFFEMRIVTDKGNVKTVTTSARILKNSQGQVVKMVGSVRDITGQRNTETELTQKLEALNRSNLELEEFAYVASHDLQEPLRKISTFCSRLSEKYADKFDKEGNMYMERVLISADNMRLLINNLLEFSRVARDAQPFAQVNLNFVLQQVKTDLELLIEDTGATIVFNGLPSINASLSQMKQLFFNLVNNAIKFRRADVVPVIEITHNELSEAEKINYSLTSGTQYYRLLIKDNGIGFDNQYAARIFKIFQRLHGKSEYPGSGIGLAICKKIVERHQGIIFAEGEEGAGSTFVIILPA